MHYDSHAPWQVLPDNHGYFTNDTPSVGFSLVRTTLDPAADPEDFRTWRASTYRLGSPGEDDPEPIVPPIYINELLTRPGGSLSDSVELFNSNPTNVHLGGWWLSDARNWPYRYRIPLGTTIPAFGFLVLDESHFNTGTDSLSFDSDGERCYLFSGDTNGNLTGYSHGFFFKGSERDVSFGRNQSTDGSDYLLQEIARTFGASNSGPRVPSLMITVLRLVASDGVFTNADDTTVDVIVRPFDAWRSSVFTSAELNAESISGPRVDPDGDGLNNMEEYFFATEPKLADLQRPLRAELVSGHLEMTWLQRAGAVDVTAFPRRADRIEGPWFEGPGLFERTEALIASTDLKRVTLRSPVPSSGSGQQFISLPLSLAE